MAKILIKSDNILDINFVKEGTQYVGQKTVKFDIKNTTVDTNKHAGEHLILVDSTGVANVVDHYVKTHNIGTGSSVHKYDDTKVKADIALNAKCCVDTKHDIALVDAKRTITPTEIKEIAANTLKSGITNAQAQAIVTNTSKVGITTSQANKIDINEHTSQTNKTDVNMLKGRVVDNGTFHLKDMDGSAHEKALASEKYVDSRADQLQRTLDALTSHDKGNLLIFEQSATNPTKPLNWVERQGNDRSGTQNIIHTPEFKLVPNDYIAPFQAEKGDYFQFEVTNTITGAKTLVKHAIHTNQVAAFLKGTDFDKLLGNKTKANGTLENLITHIVPETTKSDIYHENNKYPNSDSDETKIGLFKFDSYSQSSGGGPHPRGYFLYGSDKYGRWWLPPFTGLRYSSEPTYNNPVHIDMPNVYTKLMNLTSHLVVTKLWLHQASSPDKISIDDTHLQAAEGITW